MIKSMTGYGRQKGENERREVQVEIKSVNHRYLDLNVKVPRIYSFLEEPIKTAVSAAVARGKVDIYLSITAKEGGDAKVSPNLALAGEYLRALEQVRDTYSLKDDISVMELAHMPDLLTVAREEPDAEEVKTQVLEVLGRALEEYNAMRRTEGERLCEDIARRGQAIGKMVDQVEQRSPQSVEEYRQKIAQRMTEILGDSDIAEQRILAEAALFADKVSVTEEVVRLRSHLSQLQKMVQGDAPVGRKLDFLVQELNREANTIGSKANDYELAQIVIEIKAEIEKIREQIQNLECAAMKLINIGFGNMVSASRLVAIVSPESAPIKRVIQNAKEKNMLIDATYGRRTRAVLITDSEHVILSPLQPETVANRLGNLDYDEDEGEEEDE